MDLDFIAFEGDAVSERTIPLLPIEKLWEHHLPEDPLLRKFESLRFATPANGPNKSREDEAVEWQEGVPVEVPGKPAWVEERGLLDPGTSMVGEDLELQPRSSREFHFRSQAKEMGTIQRLDPPEVQGFADAQFAGVSAAAAHAHPTGHPID
jgi:hypothetical protein